MEELEYRTPIVKEPLSGLVVASIGCAAVSLASLVVCIVTNLRGPAGFLFATCVPGGFMVGTAIALIASVRRTRYWHVGFLANALPLFVLCFLFINAVTHLGPWIE